MSYEIQASLPTQCAKLTLAWSAPAGGKRIEAWVEGDNYFAERIAANVTGTLGTVDWVCDFPAGAKIAFEIYKLPTGQPYGTTPFFTVQPGTTDACLRQNPGQLATASMAALASSLRSASPQLFTGYSTVPTSASSAVSSSTSSSASASASPSVAPSGGGNSVSTSALVGGIVGGVAGLVLAALALWWLRRRSRRNRSRNGASELGGTSIAATTTGDEKESTPIVAAAAAPPPPAGGGGGGGGHPVSAWLGRVQPGARPPSVWSGGNISFRTALGGLSSRLPAAGASALMFPSSSTGSPPMRAQGPRADLPEVGEAGDFGSYGGGGGGGPAPSRWRQQPSSSQYAPVPTHDTTGAYSSGDTVLPLPSSLHPRSQNGSAGSPTASAATAAASTAQQSRITSESSPPPPPPPPPPRPPTRLTTPGGFSMLGTDPAAAVAATAGGYVLDHDVAGLYASRPAGER